MVSQAFSRRLRLLGLVAALGLLAGCASAQAPVEAPAESPPPEESIVETTPPEPEPDAAVDAGPLAAVTQLVIHADSLEMRDAAGTPVETVDLFMGQTDEAVAALSAVFGASPEDEDFEAGEYSPEGVRHQWGDGFELTEFSYDEARRMAQDLDDEGTFLPGLNVIFSAPTVNGIELVTAQGHQVADDWEAVLSDPEAMDSSNCPMFSILDVRDITTPAGDSQTMAVRFFGGPGAGVFSFRAPAFYDNFCFGQRSE